MKETSTRSIDTSVRVRLQRLAREQGEDFQLMLTRYANERLLFRLASSPHAGQFVLKGASLFTIWTGKPHRATRDLDLLGFGASDVEHVRKVFTEVLSLDVADDGVRFDIDTLVTGLIRDEQEYGGVRVEFVAHVTSARIRMQVDIGFGDAITPEAIVIDFPTLLAFPSPRMRAYPRETVVAEKLEAMVQLGMANSRMKDFYDVAVLARDFDFDGDLLTRAIRATFERRKTPLPASLPVALTTTFSGDPMKRTQWSGFVRKAGINAASNLAETIVAVAAFAERPLLAAAQGKSYSGAWRAPGPWTSRTSGPK